MEENNTPNEGLDLSKIKTNETFMNKWECNIKHNIIDDSKDIIDGAGGRAQNDQSIDLKKKSK